MQQGRSIEAQAGFEAALRMDAGLDAARHALVRLLLENKRNTEAEQALQEGLKIRHANSGYAMLLARLQVQRGELDQAIVTLALTLPYAAQQADYQAFYAALLQRRNRHKEAVEHYQVALKATPHSGVWLMGCGISLQALGKNDEAKDAFLQALSSKTLSPELQAFVQQKIKAL
jgi:MSHA biogenesis protein MshN